MLGMCLGLTLSSGIGDSWGKVSLAFLATLTTVAVSSYLSLRPLCLATLNWARCRIMLDRRGTAAQERSRSRSKRSSKRSTLPHRPTQLSLALRSRD